VAKAAEAYAGERYVEARRILRPIAAEVPGAASVHELLGLVHYRLGKWREAIGSLETFRTLTGSTEQHPVLADCYRAQKKFVAVAELWAELGEASPSPELMVEGRLVAAGALADQGRLADALRLLGKGWRPPSNPHPYHLRRAYGLAALQERVGDLPAARATFQWVQSIDPEFVDVSARIDALS